MVVQVIPLIAGLRDENKNLSDVYFAEGLSAEGDSGSGHYYWNETSTLPDDGYNVLQVTGVTTGRWIRIYAGWNIYTANGSLTGNRTVSLNGYNLAFAGAATSTFNADGSVTLGSLVGSGTRMVVAGPSGILGTQAIAPGTGTTTRFIEQFTATSGQTTFITANTLLNDFFDVFVNGVRLDSASYTNTSNQVVLVDGCATGDIVNVVGFSSLGVATVLPSQTGNAGKFLRTDGTNVYWDIASGAGTVTSVNMSVPTGFAISGNPITTSGTLALAFASGYALPTTIKQSNWDDAYTWVSNFPTQTGNAGKYLTTNGSTLSWGTVTLSGYVPYTGATQNVNLGAYKITADAVAFNMTPTNAPAAGQIAYNAATGALAYLMDNTSVMCNIGQQLFAYVTNDDTVTISKGQPVYLFSAAGNRASVKLAANTSDSTSAKTLGLAAENITSGQKGFIICQGVLDGLDTSAYASGVTLYLGATAGTLTSTKPYAPNHLVYIGVVERSNAGNGQIYVRTQNGYELDEIHDVDLISTPPVNNDVLTYVTGTNNLWKPRSISTILGYTPANQATTLTINGTTYDLSANRTWSVGTVTSVSALTIGTTGTDVSSTVATGTTTPVITLNIPTASATNRGALSSTDWSTFNSKQGALTLTTTGTSGAATLVGNTLNIPQYSGGGISGSGTSGQVTFWNGTSSVTGSSSFQWDGTNILLSDGKGIVIQKTGTNRDAKIYNPSLLDNLPYINFYPNSGTNVGFALQLIPKGTGYNSNIKAQFTIANTDTIADPTNWEAFVMRSTGTSFTLSSGKGGTGTIRPILLSSGFADTSTNPNQLWLYSSNNVGINTSSDAGFRLDVNGTARIQGDLTTNLTSGSVPFIGTSGVLAQDNTNFFWDNTNKRLGIGINTPAYSIDVLTNINTDPGMLKLKNSSTGNAAGTSFELHNNLGYIGFQILSSNYTASGVLQPNSARFRSSLAISNGIFIGTGATAPLTFFTGDTERFKIFGSTGNVLIQNGGTFTDAGFRLDVSGTARVQGTLATTDFITNTKNVDGTNKIEVINTNSGTSSETFFNAISDAASGQIRFGKYSSTHTTYKTLVAKDSFIYNSSTGGDISLLNDFATGNIKFAAGGSSTAHMTIKSNGRINMSSLPTSSAGLSAGDLWNDAGTLKIV